MTKKTKSTTNRWSESRKGFKHELIETLHDLGYTYRKAGTIVEVVFSSIRKALIRREKVHIEGFGAWHVQECPFPPPRRMYRFGEVVTRNPYKVSFSLEQGISLLTKDDWKPHKAWEQSLKAPPTLRGKKKAEHLRKQKVEHNRAILIQYIRPILEFFSDHMQLQDWNLFWHVRWNTHWFQGKRPEKLRPLNEAKLIIAETMPRELSRGKNDRAIELVEWYDLWTSQLDVDPVIWKFAEQEAEHHLYSPDRGGAILRGQLP